MTISRVNQFVRKILAFLLFAVASTLLVTAQEIRVRGTVTDQLGTLPGVNIQVKGASLGTSTDASGNYSIAVADKNAVLVFSYVGYVTQETTVGNRTTINIVMKDNERLLDEVVVVGYGVVKKSDVTGSVSSISADAMNTIPTTNINEMLRGQAAGIQITSSSSRPGGSSEILIRGQKSLGAKSAPLFILDGVPVENIDDINSSDIKSVEVLKDASAQSIYGARAASGVILVTTRRGEAGKTTIDVNTMLTTQWIHRNFDYYSGEEFAQLRREAYRTSSSNGQYVDDSVVFSPSMLDALKNKQFTDWEDTMISNATLQKYDISVRRGTEHTKFATSLGYFNQDGMVPSSGFERFTYRLNIDQKIFKNVTLGANISYTKSNQSLEDGNFYKMVTMDPLSRAYDDDGNMLSLTGDQVYSPLFDIYNSYNRVNTRRMMINAYLDWEILKGLTYRLNTSLNNRNYERGAYLNSKHSKGINLKGDATLENRLEEEYLIENILTYSKEINKDNNFDITLMQSANQIDNNRDITGGSGFNNDLLGHHAIASASTIKTPTHTKTRRTLLSYMGRVRYSLMDKYLLTASLRVDGSSVFGANNKYGYFPSVALAWKVNNEAFMQNFTDLSTLKLRLSYGSVGNQALSPYQSLGVVSTFGMLFGENTYLTGYLPTSQLYNPNLKWETSTSTNAGVDFGFFNERISGTVEYYNTITSDLLMTRALKESSGYSSQMVNMGKIRNRGVEVSLTGYPIRTRDLSWSVTLNWSKNKNKILALNGETDANGKPKDNLNNNWFIGKSINVYYDYQFDGIWQTTDDIANSHMPAAKPGDIRLKDVVDDNQITPDDRVVIEKDPDWIGSLSSTFKYKGIDLGVDLYMLQGGKRENRALHFYDYGGGSIEGKMNGIKQDYWMPDNPSNTFPRPSRTTPKYLSSLSYQDASYFRIRNIIMGYTLPGTVTKKFLVEKLRVYASLNNIYTSSKYLSYGPESGVNGYPEPVSFTAGLNITF